MHFTSPDYTRIIPNKIIPLRPQKTTPPLNLLPHENELIVVVPPILFGVDTWLEFGCGGSCSPRAAAACETEALLDEHVEGLLQEEVLQEEAGRVALRLAVIRVATLVQRLAEDLPAQTVGMRDIWKFYDLYFLLKKFFDRGFSF